MVVGTPGLPQLFIRGGSYHERLVHGLTEALNGNGIDCVGVEYFGAGFDGEELGQREIGFLKAKPADSLAQATVLDLVLRMVRQFIWLLDVRGGWRWSGGLRQYAQSKPERAAMPLTELMSDAITEAEKIFRDIRSIVFESAASYCCRPGIGTQELKRVVSMVNVVAGCYTVPAEQRNSKG